MKREPVPILVTSAFLLLCPCFDSRDKNVDFEAGRLTRTVKVINVFWQFLVALFVFLLCLELFSNVIIAGVGALLDSRHKRHDVLVDRFAVVDCRSSGSPLPTSGDGLGAAACAPKRVCGPSPSVPPSVWWRCPKARSSPRHRVHPAPAVSRPAKAHAPKRRCIAAAAQTGLCGARARIPRDAGAMGGSQRDQPWTPGDDRGSRRRNSRSADDFDRAAPARIVLRFKSAATDAAARPVIGLYACGHRERGKVECRQQPTCRNGSSSKRE